jgi:uncharacterized damage-inducible protein DinB
MMLKMFQTLYRYNWWATTRLLTALKEFSSEELRLDLGGSYPTILSALLHTLWVEQMFLQRWRRQSTQGLASPPILDTIEAIHAAWRQLEYDRALYFETLAEIDLQTPLEYQDSRGRHMSIVLWEALFHCANHSTFHRGQIVSKLRQSGQIPPGTDFVVFCHEVH